MSMDTLDAAVNAYRPDGLLAQEPTSTDGKSQESWGTPAVNDANKTPHCEINSKQAGLSKSVGIMESQKSSKKLNPNWVEQLMGLPVGWTQLPTEWID